MNPTSQCKLTFYEDDPYQRDGGSSWNNCSMNASRISGNNEGDEQKNPSEIYININIYQKLGSDRRNKFKSQEPNTRKKQDLQNA